ncbi:MAG: replicative DNA helicase [Candidatus Tokpelaia sp. JSC161]|jgi:replicative DNA helicase|nr:MAG: replicative DNA helicase [Candidatus Tokpelaia sp. JSC161]
MAEASLCSLEQIHIEKQITSPRKMPHNIEAEQLLLGALFINNDAFDRVSDFLQAKHFFEPLHATIYKIISKFINAGKHADPVTLKPFIPADKKIGNITVFNYTIRLMGEALTVINAKDYGRIIYDLYIRRSLINIGEDIINTAYDSPMDLPPLRQIENAEKHLFQLAETGKYENGFENFSEALSKAVTMMESALKRSSNLSGLSTHIHALDTCIGGMHPSDLIIIAGRPGMGKTSLATNIGFNIALTYQENIQQKNLHETEGGIVGFFSLEMSSEQLATRIISEQLKISSSKMRNGNITEYEFTKMMQKMQNMQKVPFYIDQTGGISINQLTARARRLKRQHNLHLLIVDYIQLITTSSRQVNRVQEITEITMRLKSLAKELNIPIIALSQLSRQVESREDKRPQLSDLRESGSIEQDADIVLFVYRKEYYMKNREPKVGTEEHAQWQSEMESIFGKAEIIIAKQRHGPTGTAELAFQAEFTRFSDINQNNSHF